MLAGRNPHLIGRNDGHEGSFVPRLDDDDEIYYSHESMVEERVDVDKKHHHKKTTTKPASGHVHGGRMEVEERVDVVDAQHLRLEVPQLQMMRSASVLHDFNSVRPLLADVTKY